MNNAATEIKKVWRIIAVGHDCVLELRAIWPKGSPETRPARTKHFRACDYPSLDALRLAFENAALSFNAAGYNVYTVMNPIKADFSGSGGAKDPDIRYRDLLLVDIDRIGDTSSPANQMELDAAKALAGEIREYLHHQDWPEPFTVMSGNGFHLYYLIDTPNDEQSTELVRATLKNLARIFDNKIVGVDTTVFNASRITKVPGTIMRKGLATEDRPYRMAVVYDEN